MKTKQNKVKKKKDENSNGFNSIIFPAIRQKRESEQTSHPPKSLIFESCFFLFFFSDILELTSKSMLFF